jgi:hypothetical protein
MKNSASLEVTLRRRDSDSYSAVLRSTLPDGEVDVTSTGVAQFDFERLRALSLQTLPYADLLTNSLFKDPAVATAFNEVRSAAQALETTLQIRLVVDSNAAELHSLHWETLLDLRDGSYLFSGEQVLFSRYLSSLDWQPVHLSPRTQLKALVVVANPANLAEFQLPPVDVQSEVTRAQTSMRDVGVTTLASAGTATLNNLSDRLRDGGHDILYLVCHGSMVDGEPWLWMEDGTGNVARVNGSSLVTRLKDLRQRPRLIVLASCQSAGSGKEGNIGALVSLGPRLAEAGIPAVLAMQGSVSMETVSDFMPVFFRELSRDGQIDRATAVARGAVNDRPDFWMPVLFMRLKSGRIWDENPELPRNLRQARISWRRKALVFVAIAVLVAGLALAYVRKSKRSHPSAQSNVSPITTQQDTNQAQQQKNQVQQTSSGQGSPNVQGVHGDVTITVDQSNTESQKPPAKKPKKEGK